MDNTMDDFDRVDKKHFIPQRYILSTLTAVASFTVYSLNVSFSVALAHMIVPHGTNGTSNGTTSCKYNYSTTGVRTDTGARFDWDSKTIEYISWSYFIAYCIGHYPGGIFSVRYGGREVILVTVLVPSLLKLFTPLLLRASDGHYIVAMGIRVMMGLLSGMISPSIHTLLSSWSPKRELGRISSISFCGSQIAVAFNKAVNNKLILSSKSWSSVFYLYGSLGLCWSLIWYVYGFSHYALSHYVTVKEYEYLKREIGDSVTLGRRSVPWRHLLTSTAFLAVVSGHFGHLWMWFVMLNTLPKYIEQMLHFNFVQSQVFASVPFLFMGMFTFVTGYMSDCIINRKYMPTTMVRKIMTTFGLMGSATFSLAAVYSGCRRFNAITNFTIGMSLMSGYYAGARTNSLDIAPNYSGIVMAIANSMTLFPSILIPKIVEAFTPQRTFAEWHRVVWLFLGILFFINIVYMTFASGKEQPWNKSKTESRTGGNEADDEHNVDAKNVV